MQTLGLKNINLLTKEQFDGIEIPATDELYAVSGSGYGFPSDNYVDYPFSTPVTTLLTAPANGYFCAFVVNSSTKANFGFNNTTTGVNVTTPINADVGNGMGLILPVRKNDVVLYNYLNINTAHESAFIRFYYAEGEE